MKKTICLIATLLIAVMILSTTAFATTYVKFTKNAVGYTKPGSGKTETIVRKGSVSSIETTKNGWTKVILGQKNALWFKSSCLKTVENGKGTVVFSAGGNGLSSHNEGDAPETYKAECKKVLASGKCSIRTQPCLSGKNIGTLKKGAELTYQGKRCVDSRGVYWYKVKTSKGDTAWVSSVYTAPVK